MFRRAWNFVKRHRKKFICGVLVGGSYVAYRVLLPRLQDRLLRKLLEDVQKELTVSGEGGADTVDTGAAKRRRARFRHRQEVSDAWVQKALAELRERHGALFQVEACKAKLEGSKGLSREEKLELLKALQVECLARTVSATYTLNLLMLVCRVAFNIVGRDLEGAASAKNKEGADEAYRIALSMLEKDAEGNADAKGKEGTGEADLEPTHAAFLEATRHLEVNGVGAIAKIVRTAVVAHVEKDRLLPQTAFTAESIEKLFVDVCSDVEKCIFTVPSTGDAEDGGVGSTAPVGGNIGAAALILPESLDQQALATGTQVNALLEEARDYLESPQLLEALRAVLATSVRRLVGELTGEKPAAAGDAEVDVAASAAAPLRGGASCPLAKLFGPLLVLSGAILDPGASNPFVSNFSNDASVRSLCEVLYFQDETSKAEPQCPQQ